MNKQIKNKNSKEQIGVQQNESHLEKRKMNARLLMFFIGIIALFFIATIDNLNTQYAYAGCVATILPQPCFDAFMGSHEPMTQQSIMESFARNIETRYPDWETSDRTWDDLDEKLNLPAIICTEFVADGVTQYRMAKWVDAFTISSFENHRNDWMCDTWLSPIDDGIAIRWDKGHYLPDDIATVQVIDKEMNLDENKIDSFKMRVSSDVDRTGIQLVMAETFENSGMFEGAVFFTTVNKSGGNRLLVEDAVYATHKENHDSSRITDESKSKFEPDSSITPPSPDDFSESRDDARLISAYLGLSLAGIVIGFFIIKKWRNRK